MKITKENLAELEAQGFLENCTYLLFNERSGYYYIGSTENAKRRLRDHLRELNAGTHKNVKFQNAYSKDSEFELEVVPLKSREEAIALEQILIDNNRKDPKLLNLALDVQTPRLGVTANAETRERQSKAAKAFYANGGTNSMEGKIHSPETKARLSAIAQEQFSTPETRAALSQRGKERFADQEQRVLTSQQTQEAMKDPELRKQLSESAKARWEDPEQRRRQSEMAKTRFTDPEQLKYTQAAGRKAWADPAFREKKSRKVSVDGVIYESLTQAAEHFGISVATVCYRASSSSEQFKDWNYV